MRAQKDTFRGRLGGRIARTIGALAIASGVAVTGAATSAGAVSSTTDTLTLHNNSASNYSIVGGKCDGFALPDPSVSYWHFIVSTNTYSFVSLTLHLDPPGTTVTYTSASPNVSINGKHAYIPVPSGATLASLQLDSTATITPAASVDSLPNFNLSHTCSVPQTPPPPVDVCDNIDENQAEVPEGMFVNDEGDCVTDVCTNLEGGQEQVPQGYTSDGEGTCTETPPPVDVCDNLKDDQAEVPEGMFVNDEGDCVTDVCDNLEGGQEQVPQGYTSDGEGTCTPPVDVCNNIDDNQAEIPAGLISDGNGGCVTPPPPPVDVCNNIGGNQASIPADLISDGNGGCVTPTPPVVDLCTNIDGVQTSVPSGFSVDGTTCTAPPVDVCNNIDGNQASIPAGTVSDGKGGCVASQVASDAPTPSVIDLCANIAGDQLEVPSGYTLNNGNCEIVASEAVSPPADVTLPVTGANTTSGIIIGLGMVAAGVVLSVLARRRTARTNS